jgi:hypothetical protein
MRTGNVRSWAARILIIALLSFGAVGLNQLVGGGGVLTADDFSWGSGELGRASTLR